MHSFAIFVFNNKLIEISGQEVPFTWTNNRPGKATTYEKLDLAFCSKNWCILHNKAALLTWPIQRSDHSPLVTSLILSPNLLGSLKHFGYILMKQLLLSVRFGKLWFVD